MDYKDPTELWDALECKYAVSKDGHLLYICEQLFDFSINAAKSIVMQAICEQLFDFWLERLQGLDALHLTELW
jgi:hypothetical protein